MANQVHGARSLGQRETQEDAYRLVLQSEKDPKTDVLMLVADGMGGHVGGEIASNLALKVFEKHFISGSQAPKPGDRLREALIKANEAISARVKEDPKLKGMGCTLIGALKLGDRIIWVSVGDSLIYLYRGGQLRRLNADHSLMAELMEAVNAGKMSLEEAKSHPRRNALRSAVIGEPLKLIDSNGIGLQSGDLLVIATDGLDTLDHDTLADALHRNQKGSVEAIAEGLLDLVEGAGKPNQDNTTVVAYRHGVEGHSSLYKDSKWKLGAAGGGATAAPAKGGLSTMLIGVLVGLGIAALGLMVYLISQPAVEEEPMVVETEPEAPADDEPLITIEPGPQEVGGDDPVQDTDPIDTDPTPDGGIVPFDPNAPEGGIIVIPPADTGAEDGGATDGQEELQPEDGTTTEPEAIAPEAGADGTNGDGAQTPDQPDGADAPVTESSPPPRQLPQVGDDQ